MGDAYEQLGLEEIDFVLFQHLDHIGREVE
jgi:hypothetical protein